VVHGTLHYPVGQRVSPAAIDQVAAVSPTKFPDQTMEGVFSVG